MPYRRQTADEIRKHEERRQKYSKVLRAIELIHSARNAAYDQKHGIKAGLKKGRIKRLK